MARCDPHCQGEPVAKKTGPVAAQQASRKEVP